MTTYATDMNEVGDWNIYRVVDGKLTRIGMADDEEGATMIVDALNGAGKPADTARPFHITINGTAIDVDKTVAAVLAKLRGAYRPTW